jgi:hypothetical protein
MFGMTAYQRRGFHRLAIVLAVPWVLGWGLDCWSNINDYYGAKRAYSFWEEEFQKALKNSSGPYAPILEEQLRAIKEMTQARERAWRTVEIGIGGPFGLVLIGVGTVWVRRGFQPDDTARPEQ